MSSQKYQGLSPRREAREIYSNNMTSPGDRNYEINLFLNAVNVNENMQQKFEQRIPFLSSCSSDSMPNIYLLEGCGHGPSRNEISSKAMSP